MIYTVFGKRGSGKTVLIQTYAKRCSRLLVWDVIGEYDDIGYVCTSLDEFLEQASERSEEHTFKLVYQPVHEKRDIDECFDVFLRTAWIMGGCMVIVDEIDMLCTPAKVPPELFKNLNLGRHRNLGLICASRRPAQVPRLVTSQSDAIVYFMTIEPNDLAYVKDTVGKDGVQIVSHLPKYHCLVYRPGRGYAVEKNVDTGKALPLH